MSIMSKLVLKGWNRYLGLRDLGWKRLNLSIALKLAIKLFMPFLSPMLILSMNSQ